MAITLKEYGDWCTKTIDPIFARSEDEFAKDPDDEAKPFIDAKLKEVLAGRKMEYLSTDWKDVGGIIEDILDSKFDLRHASKKLFSPFEEVEYGHGGSDDYVLIAIDGKATDDELDVVFDLVHNLGADDEEVVEEEVEVKENSHEQT